MADETGQLGTTQNNGIAQGSQSQSATTADATPAQVSQEATRLAELEKELQRMKSQQGREAAEAKRQAQEAQRRAAEAERRAHEAAMSNMDDYQKALYREQQKDVQIAQMAAELERRDLLQAKFERVSQTSQETGVPVDVLMGAETPEDMAILVGRYYKGNSNKQQQDEAKAAADKAAANKVDLGGGKPNSSTTRYEQALEDAMKAKNPVEYIRLLRQGKAD